MQNPLYGLVYHIPETGSKPVPLQGVRVDANIVDMIAEVIISQTYKNVEKQTIEAIYKFPIYEAAAVCGFEATIDGQRTVKGIAKDAKQASKEYDEAIEQGHGAYLLEEQLPDVFQCSVGNITSEQTVVIKITYVTELKHDAEGEKVRFVLPTAIAPRYGSSALSTTHPTANDGKQLTPDGSYTSSTEYALDLTITCRMTAAITSIESPSHPIATELNVDGDAKISKVTLAQEITYLKDDFILVVKSRGLDEPRAFLEYNGETQTHCAMLTLVPKFQLTSHPTEFVFVVDRSGSMTGGPIQKAAQTLELILRSLPEDCHFNIVSFGSRFDSLFPKSMPYSEGTFNQALKLVQHMSADYGGTEILQVTEWVLEKAASKMPTAVFLLTDGEVWDVDRIVETVEKHLKRRKHMLRVFTLGIGSSVSHHLVESIARAGKGYAQFVADNERMEKKVVSMIRNAIRPPIVDYKITWTDEENEGGPPQSSGSPKEKLVTTVKYRQAPHNIPAIYAGVRFVVYCVFDKNVKCLDQIKLTGESQDGPMEIEVAVDPFVLQGCKMHTLAARKLIQDLEEGQSYLHDHSSYKEQKVPNEIVQEEIVKLGTMFNLASRYTSFLAIDSRGDREVRVNRPVEQEYDDEGMMAYGVDDCEEQGFGGIDEFSAASYTGLSVDAPVNQLLFLDFGAAPVATAASVAPPEPKVNPREVTLESLYKLLSFQAFGGKFSASNEFYEFFDKDEAAFEVARGGVDRDIWATCIAIAYLEELLPSLRDEWQLCRDKAERATRKICNATCDDILAKAREWIRTWKSE